jgi:LacI family transcriptional regulator
MKATIKDIARIAGVSASTVSLALNNKPGVGKDTRLRVQSIADKLNYIPNNIARSLVTKKTKNIGLIVADIAEVYFGTLARIIQDAVNSEGYNLIICNSEYTSDKECDCLDSLVGNNVDGVIMVPKGSYNTEKVANIRKPLVFLDNYIKDLDVSRVGVDNVRAAFTATQHLIDLGHRTVACITGPDGCSSSDERIIGFKKALKEAGIEFSNLLLKYTDWTVEGGYRATEELLSLNKRPTAIFVTGDTCAIGVFEALYSEGLKIPEDVAIVGFDDMKFSPFLKVSLTTVRQPLREMGESAVSLLFDEMLSNRQRARKEIILKTEMIIRESCGYKKRFSIQNNAKAGEKVNLRE